MDFLNNIQMGDDDQLSYAVSQKIATKSRARSMGLDMISAAVTGKPPLQYFEELNQEAQDVADQSQKIADARNKLTSDIANLKPRPVDDSGYRAAVDAYHQALGNAPVAPQLEQMQLNDTDKAMMGFALLLGASPNQALTRFMQVKQGLVDQRNQQTQQQFQNDYGQYTQNLRGLQSEVGIQGDMYGNAVTQSNSDYNRELSGLNTGLKDLQGQADDQRMESQRIQTAINNYERNAQDFFESMGGSIDENTYRNAIQSAQNLEQTQGLPQGSLTSILNAKYQTGATLKAKQFEEQKAQWRATFDQRIKEFEANSKIKLDHEKAWAKYQELQMKILDRRMSMQEAGQEFDQWAKTQDLRNDARALDIRENGGSDYGQQKSQANTIRSAIGGMIGNYDRMVAEYKVLKGTDKELDASKRLQGQQAALRSFYEQNGITPLIVTYPDGKVVFKNPKTYEEFNALVDEVANLSNQYAAIPNAKLAYDKQAGEIAALEEKLFPGQNIDTGGYGDVAPIAPGKEGTLPPAGDGFATGGIGSGNYRTAPKPQGKKPTRPQTRQPAKPPVKQATKPAKQAQPQAPKSTTKGGATTSGVKYKFK